MRRTVTKLAMNKATFLSLSNQMTEQLGAWGLRGRGAAYMGGQRRKCGRVAAAQAQTPPGPQAQPLRAVHCPSLRPGSAAAAGTPPAVRCSHDACGGVAGQERRGSEAGQQPDEGAAAAQDNGGDVARCAREACQPCGGGRWAGRCGKLAAAPQQWGAHRPAPRLLPQRWPRRVS